MRLIESYAGAGPGVAGRGGGGGAVPAGGVSFVGRGGELALVRELLAGAGAGVGGLLVVAGEQGIGKSSLLRAGLEGGAAGCRVLRAAADELGRPIPLRLMEECLGAAVPDPVPGPGGALTTAAGVFGGDAVMAGVERMLARVDRLCAVSPVVLVTEDLQWADEASVLVWSRLARAVGQVPLLLVGSYRPGTGREDLGRLGRGVLARGGHVVELGPLTDGEVAELAGGRAGGRPGRHLAAVMGQAGGNPMYARELADSLVRDGQVTVAGGVAELTAVPAPVRVPVSLDAAIGRRLAGLAPDAVRVLRWAAVLGAEFSVTDLEVVSGQPVGDLMEMISTALRAGVLAEAGTRLEFRHGLIRQALYEGLPAARRTAMHIEAARALATAGAAAGRVASQLAAAQQAAGPGGELASDWAASWLAAAAPVLSYRVPQAAAELYRGVLATLPADDHRREILQASLATVSFLLMRPGQVEHIAGPLAATARDPARAAEMAWLLAYSRTRAGRLAEADAVIEAALTRLDRTHTARLLALRAIILVFLGQFDKSEKASDEALTAAEESGDRLAAGYAHHTRTIAAHRQRTRAAAHLGRDSRPVRRAGSRRHGAGTGRREILRGDGTSARPGRRARGRRRADRAARRRHGGPAGAGLGAGTVRRTRRGVGRAPGHRQAAPARDPAHPRRLPAPAPDRLGSTDPHRTQDRRPRRRRPVKPRHRRPPLPLPQHRANPRLAHPHQTRRTVPRRNNSRSDGALMSIFTLSGRPHPGRSAIAITAAVIVSVAALPAAAVSASAQPSTSPTAASPAARSGAAKAEPLLLINGDLLSVSSAGKALIASLTARPDPDPLWTLSTGSGTYEFPVDAIPYLGHGLDASLFNVTLLRRLESGGRLPVRLSYGGAVPSVPGITITSSGDGLAAGYLTAASAAAFGRALDQQFAAGHASGYYGGLFGGVNIALAGASIAAPVRPQFPMRTLTVTATNEWGKPDRSDEIMVLNADDLETFSDPYESLNVFHHGSAKFSVPVGHYWALTNFMRLRGETVLSQRIVVLPQFTVSGTSTTVHVAAAAASSLVTFSTPRPATTAAMSWMIARTGRQGPPALAIFTPFSTPLWISPTKARPSAGSLTSYTQAQLFSPAKMKGTPYEYTLDFSGPPGIVPAQHFTATQANLATIHEKIYDNAKSTARVMTLGGSLAQISEPIFIENLFTTAMVKAPGEQTEYISGGPSYIWLTSVSLGDASLLDEFHTLPNDRSFSESWNQYPLHPQPDVNLLTGPAADSYPDTPMGYRIGNETWFDPIPFSDNDSQFGHINETNYPSTYRIIDNGRQVAGGGFIGDGEATMPPTASTVSFSLRSVQGPDPRNTLSPRTYTVWTMRTAAEPAAKVPPSWECSTNQGETRNCAVLSMLTLDYQVRHLSLDGVAPAGPQQVSVSVGHIQLSRPSAIVSAKARVSWDNGLSWHSATVTGTSAGNYLVSFTPPPTVDVTLSFTARDAAGGSVSETITSAYAVGPAPGTAHTTRAGSLRVACPSARAGDMQCFALYRPQTAVNRAIAAGETGEVSHPVGLTPKEIKQAYRLPVGRLSDQTVAVSIAFNTPHLAEYLAKYRQTFGLPPCTTASGCFRVVNQYGNRSPKKLPVSGVGSGWDIEVTLDVSMISVACPHCKILVVEANNDSARNLARTDDTAATLGAEVISNSYGIRENGNSIESAKSYDHPGHTIVVAAGDLGFTAAEFPADLTTVTAVGGTELARARTARGWREQVWYAPMLPAAGGSGCSAYVAKPGWQHDPDCLDRTIADVSAVAANIPIYNRANGGWLTVGGTSVAAPLVAGIYALAGNATTIPLGYAYSHRRFLFDITKGTNSVFYPSKLTCGNDYPCAAKKGYDAPTGLGTPDGTGAF